MAISSAIAYIYIAAAHHKQQSPIGSGHDVVKTSRALHHDHARAQDSTGLALGGQGPFQSGIIHVT